MMELKKPYDDHRAHHTIRQVLVTGVQAPSSNSRYSACCPSLRLNKALLRWLTASSRSNRGEIMPKMGVIGCRETALFVLQTHQAWDDQRSPGSPTDTPRIP